MPSVKIRGHYFWTIFATVLEKYLLYAEDDADDQEMLLEMLNQVDSSLRLICVSDGYDVIHFMNNLDAGSNYPCVIILDINMPGCDGIQTLRLLKNDPRYRNIPVVMFSTSNSMKDKDESAAAGAADFFTKPLSPAQLEAIATNFAAYCQIVPAKIN